jgi:hypothetical protein
MRLTMGKRHAHLGSTRVIPETARVKINISEKPSRPLVQAVLAQRFSVIDSDDVRAGVGILWRHISPPEIQPKARRDAGLVQD